MKTKITIRCLLYLVMTLSINSIISQNLLDTSTWTEGTGSTPGFTRYGTVSENSRTYHPGPFGATVLAWKASPIIANYANGGWNTGHHNIDSKETYRFTVWIKKTGSNGGSSYLGCYGNNILNLNGDVMDNPYFWHGDLPQLNKWYLLVGYVHGSNYNSNENYGGIYDPVTGEKVRSGRDFKFSDGATWTRHRSYLVNTPNATDRQYFWRPRLEQVSGEEPIVEDLLGLNDDSDCNKIWGTDTWPVGSEVLAGFANNGPVSENSRVLGKNHIGENVILWEASPGSDGEHSGGFNTRYYPVNKTKTHRFSVWIKKTNSNDGVTYFGCNSYNNIFYLSGNVENNPYFWAGDLPKLNRWYLLVGYVHKTGHQATANLGRIYDGVTGKEVASMRDFKFGPNTQRVRHRAYLYYDTNTNNRQYFYEPRIDELSGCEPSITELLKVNPESRLIFSFDTAGNQTQRFYCSDPEYCSPIAAKKKEIEAFRYEEALGLEDDPIAETIMALNIYPNPTSGIATIQIEKEWLSEIEFIKVFTANAVLIKEIELKMDKNKFDVNLSEQPTGLYFVHAHLKDGSSMTKKMIKK